MRSSTALPSIFPVFWLNGFAALGKSTIAAERVFTEAISKTVKYFFSCFSQGFSLILSFSITLYYSGNMGKVVQVDNDGEQPVIWWWVCDNGSVTVEMEQCCSPHVVIVAAVGEEDRKSVV